MAKYNANFFMVDNVARPVPSEMSVTIQKLSRSDAGRCEDGVMHVNYVRRVRSIQFSWKDLPPEDIAELCDAFDGADYFDVSYQDPKDGPVTRTFYAGDISTKVYSWTTRFKRYDSMTLNVIER